MWPAEGGESVKALVQGMAQAVLYSFSTFLYVLKLKNIINSKGHLKQFL